MAIRRILLLLFSLMVLGSAFAAHSLVRSGSTLEGAIAFIIMGLLWCVVVAPVGKMLHASHSSSSDRIPLAAFILGLAAASFSGYCFLTNQFLTEAWLGWAFGFVLLLLALRPRCGPSVVMGTNVRPDLWIMFVIVALALVLHLFSLESLPPGFWFDDANGGIVAKRLVTEESFRQPFLGEGIEQPTLFYWFVSLSLAVIGDSIVALRLPAVLFGTAFTLSMFGILSVLTTSRFVPLLGALLVATSPWLINFSRWSSNAMCSVFIDSLVLYYLCRGSKKNDGKAFATALLLQGLSLHLYYSSRAFALFTALFCLLHLLTTKDRARIFFSMLSGGVGALAVASPLIAFAIRAPASFFGHLSALSVPAETSFHDHLLILWNNFLLHLGLFNFRADAMMRHALPDGVILGEMGGALFALALAWALFSCLSSLTARTLILGFLVTLLPGVLCRPVDLPTSLRTIESSIFVYALCALFLGSPLTNKHMAEGALTRAFAGLIAVAVTLSVGAEGVRQFIQHMTSPSVWAEFHGAHRRIAEVAQAELHGKGHLIVSDVYAGHPAFRFLGLSPLLLPYGQDSLPLLDASANTLICLRWSETDRRVYDFYPNARHFPIVSPDGGRVEADCTLVTPDDVEATFGWQEVECKDTSIARSRAQGSSNSGFTCAGVKLFRAIFASPRFGPHQFRIDPSLGQSWLSVGGSPFHSAGSRFEMLLYRGPVSVEVALPRTSPHSPADLRILSDYQLGDLAPIPSSLFLRTPPIHANGLLGRYYKGMCFEGEPVEVRLDSSINSYFQVHIVPQPNSIIWSGNLLVDAEQSVTFRSRAIDYLRVYLDGEIVHEDNSRAVEVESTPVPLKPGPHKLTVAYSSFSGYAEARLFWDISGEFAPIPTDKLTPSIEALRPRDCLGPGPGGQESLPVASRPLPETIGTAPVR